MNDLRTEIGTEMGLIAKLVAWNGTSIQDGRLPRKTETI